MPPRIADPHEFLFTVVCFGVGGSVLALVGIWLEVRRGPRAGRCFSGLLFLLLSALAGILWVSGRPTGVVGPLLALGAAGLAAYAMQTASLRRMANRIIEPRAVWMLLLFVSPIVATVYALHLSKIEALPTYLTEEGIEELRRDTTGPRAVTDLGRDIVLFHYTDLHSPEMLEASLLEAGRYTHEVIRVEGPSSNCNSHGWVFTGGAYGVSGEQVDMILADNGYLPVEYARSGDLVIHRDDSGLPRHTGVVRFVGDDGIVLEESKWGPLGVFLHTPETQPFASLFGFWRSPRQGHRIEIPPPTRTERAGP